MKIGVEAAGHGTHVAGTLAGAQSGTKAGDDEADGMAFAGQLAVFDFGDSDAGNALTTPDEVKFDRGVRVSKSVALVVFVKYVSRLCEECGEERWVDYDLIQKVSADSSVGMVHRHSL